jgi:hypothetical protein
MSADAPKSSDVQRGDEADYVDPVIEAYKKDIDRTLIRYNLRLSVQERFENLMEMQQFAEELVAAIERVLGEDHA